MVSHKGHKDHEEFTTEARRHGDAAVFVLFVSFVIFVVKIALSVA